MNIIITSSYRTMHQACKAVCVWQLGRKHKEKEERSEQRGAKVERENGSIFHNTHTHTHAPS